MCEEKSERMMGWVKKSCVCSLYAVIIEDEE